MWRSRTGSMGSAIEAVVREHDVDVWVLTETRRAAGPLPWMDRFLIDAGRDWGYRLPHPDRRKVLMCSPHPWSDVEVGESGAMRGRLVAGTTDTPGGPLRVVGVCIPWRLSHVESGRRDLRPWDDHRDFLRQLPSFLTRQPPPCVIAGDFNQRVPLSTMASGVRAIVTELARALAEFRVVTRGVEPDLLDHIAVSPDVLPIEVSCWPGTIEGRELTDHWGTSALIDIGRSNSSE